MACDGNSEWLLISLESGILAGAGVDRFGREEGIAGGDGADVSSWMLPFSPEVIVPGPASLVSNAGVDLFGREEGIAGVASSL
jgi:hypothetical protein